MTLAGPRPDWLTFDCYGTLIQWDEGLLEAVETILSRCRGSAADVAALIEVYDHYEHLLEQTPPHRSFREVAGAALQKAMVELGLPYHPSDIATLTDGIAAMPPFPEVVDSLGRLKRMGFSLCVISNTDDDIIAGNVAQMGGHVDRVITAEQAQSYKPSRRIFEHAHECLGVAANDIVHICASPHLDLAAARDIGFRCVWINRGTGRTPLPDYVPDAEFATLDRAADLFADLGWDT